MMYLVPRVAGLAIGGLMLASIAVSAQHAHAGSAAPGAHRAVGSVEAAGISARAREQVAAVEKAVAGYASLDAASTAGFYPFLGMLPTMGLHAVNQGRILDDVNLLEPDVLMFGSVDGERRLVGVAYGFLGKTADAPDLFDGPQDAWHEHPELAPPGQSLVMLHVWFVPSPDGPFAGHNPWLGYWAAGVEPPADSVMADPATASRARRLGVALGETAEPVPVALAQMGTAGLESAPGAAAWRDSIRAIVPRLDAARKAGAAAAWDREADAAIALSERIRDAYLQAVPDSESRDELASFYREMETGEHAH